MLSVVTSNICHMASCVVVREYKLRIIHSLIPLQHNGPWYFSPIKDIRLPAWPLRFPELD